MARLHRSPVMPASLPPGWDGVLSAMTRREVELRPSAQDAGTALRGLATGDATTVLAPPPVQERTTVLPRTTASVRPPIVPTSAGPGQRRTAWVVGAVLAVLVLGAVGYLLSQQSSPTARQIPAVSNDLPTPVRSDLQQFVNQVEAR